MLTNTALKSRFCASGPISLDVHLIDLFLYDSSLFTNILVIEDSDFTAIIDTGNSNTIGTIKNYLYFNQIALDRVIIIPTHSHFDHSGGLFPLIEYLKTKNSEVTVLTTSEMKSSLIKPENYVIEARKGFQNAVGEMKPIPEKLMQIVDPNEPIPLGNQWEIKLLPTPGHSDDHLSPLLTNAFGEKIVFLGEAFGINLKNDLYPIPASSAPHFHSAKYIESIKKILQTEPDLGIFSHFGGVQGKYNIQRTGKNAINMLIEFQEHIKQLYEQTPRTGEITRLVYEDYADTIATMSLNENLAKNLAFTIIYGMLQDLGLKPRK